VHTKKLYHIGQRIPFWVRAMLPGLNFDLEEEAWTLGPHGEITLVLPRIPPLAPPQLMPCRAQGTVSQGARCLRAMLAWPARQGAMMMAPRCAACGVQRPVCGVRQAAGVGRWAA